MGSKKQKGLWAFIGGLSQPDKMPGWGFSIPAQKCKLGALLAKISGSVCFGCYALDRGSYAWEVVKNALQRRFNKIEKACKDGQAAYREKFITAFSDLLNLKLATYKKRKAEGKPIRHHSNYFRWHDAGDIQSVSHLELIAEVCRRTPGVKHWIPTREYQTVKTWLKAGNVIPTNLVIRLSSHYINKDPVSVGFLIGAGCTISGVHTDHRFPDTMKRFTWKECPAFKTLRNGKRDKSLIGSAQTGYCGNCRRCWNRDCLAISYPYHGSNDGKGNA